MADAVPSSSPEILEALQTRHRKEQRDLVSRTTQKKKQATKKTRKGVNDECERLERELKERQDAELRALSGETTQEEQEEEQEDGADDEALHENELSAQTSGLTLNNSTPTSTNGDEAEAQAAGETSSHKKKPNRAKARLARRAAETTALIAAAEREAASAPNPRAVERSRMATQLERRKLALHEIRADGHCLYAAVADQLVTREVGFTPRIQATIAGAEGEGVRQMQGQWQGGYKDVRCAAADWIQAHPDDFAGFVEDALPEHVRKVRETGEWGGHVELLALARTYGVRICVLHSDGRVDAIEPESDEGKEIWLGYYEHSHGLGEHYNSLRKIG